MPPEYVAKTDAERQCMIKEADFAYRQAFALSPGSPETVYRYVQFLVNQYRTDDAITVAETAYAIHPGKPDGDPFRLLLDSLNKIRSQQTNTPSSHQ